jgi:dTMP kinase
MFVVFEGIDGSGKTTVSNLVVEQLRERGLTVKHLRAEGKFVSAVSEAIRTLARDSRNLELDPRTEFLLYVARDVQIIEEALREALRTHDIVVADRFLYTAEVLGRYGRGLPNSYTAPVLEAAAGGITPDLVVLIDVDPVLARARRKSSKVIANDTRPPSRKGLAGVGLQHRVRRGYLELARESPERWFVANNEEVLADTVQRVARVLGQALEQGAPAALRRERSVQTSAAASSAEVRTPEAALDKLKQWLHARAEREPQVAAYVLAGLRGEQVDGLRSALAERAPTVVLSGLGGLNDDVSWALREQLCEAHPTRVAQSLRGISGDHPRLRALRPRLERLAPEELAKSLSRQDDEAAWALRDRLYEAHPHAVMASLGSLSSVRARALRERWLSEHKKLLRDNYELSHAAARSVHALDDDHGWEIRELVHASAPISSLGSIDGLTSERSWTLRERFLRRATKTVMQTLHYLSDARAFELRRAVAAESKEAIDSLVDLDAEEAWELRETYRDLWPSTVVKTLGRLADGARGRALLERQLLGHAGNVSLLKHASAVALGCHHRPLRPERLGAARS